MISRRGFCIGGALAAAVPLTAVRPAIATTDSLAALRARALGSLERHHTLVTSRERIGIVDFSRPSRERRFYILDMASGNMKPLLVAHGKGSDPEHKGWLERFSNEPGSEASSAGAYLTGSLYDGRHGRSRRLAGLDASNSNAEARALVIHAAWYVNPILIRERGMLGRSQGCLAVAGDDLDGVLNALPAGSLIYVDKL